MVKRLALLNQLVVVLGSASQILTNSRSESLTRRKVAESLLSRSLPLDQSS